MKSLNQYINEKLIVNSKTRRIKHKYFPKTKEELQKLIFSRIENEGNNCDLNDIDVSKITDMSYLLGNEISQLFENFNCDISQWDMSNVTDAMDMFSFCKKFNGDLSRWNLQNLENAGFMFKCCESFEGKGLENWNTSNIANARGMFMNCYKFNPNISNWDVSNIIDSCYMFDGCKKFNCDLSKWNMESLPKGYNEDMFERCPINNNIEKQPKF